MSTPAQRLAMAHEIVNLEARRDAQGHLKVYSLPSNDGGGKYEVAGINTRYNPRECAALVGMIEAGQFKQADEYATDFIARDTDSAALLTTIPAIESYLRDCVFNRGATGAVKILQMALDVDADGEVGPNTKKAMAEAEKDPAHLLAGLRAAREAYELKVAGRRENLWKGLVSRWDKALVIARKFPLTATAVDGMAPKNWLAVFIEGIFDFLAAFWKDTSTGPKTPAAKTPWMSWALKEEGFHETGTNMGTEKYIDLAKAGSRGALLGEPWCAVWANAGLESQGIPGTRSAMARSFEDHPNFIKLNGPAYGCIVVMWRESKGSGKGHVFYYLGENEKGVLGLGGNQKDSVCRQYHPRNRIVGYYWPKSVPLPVTSAVTVKDEKASGGTET